MGFVNTVMEFRVP